MMKLFSLGACYYSVLVITIVAHFGEPMNILGFKYIALAARAIAVLWAVRMPRALAVVVF